MPLCRPDNKPDVSVIIPVFNKLELTRACLASILEQEAQASFEIIIVDNGSTDDTGRWLEEQAATRSVKGILSSENIGFARGCNLGAAHADGRYLLFLNNDMEVLANWLDPMVCTLDNDPSVGITGAKLLFPDQTIQHAGVALVRSDQADRFPLSGIHIAYKKPAYDLAASLPLKLQIVTGACLMIRSEIFSDLSGFDDRYWNGNEDVDLCLRAGEMGWRVVYRPESRIIHHESQSGPERWSQVKANVRLFNQIWLDRAKPDLIQTDESTLVTTADSRIRPYAEPRLRRSVTTGDAVSIIVLTWNALEYTKQCAASLLEHTDPRHEIIFVDNGSGPDTVKYLQELERGSSRVRVLFNGSNLGFSAGNNRGIAAARHGHVCLLNSDTVVTEGWLESMLGHLQADPDIGLVGPLTNSITGPQKLEKVDYNEENCQGLTAFARQLVTPLAGHRQETLWVVGFCLLIRDTLLIRIGGLDESFGQGNYEDTDYCLRAMVGGYKSVIAADSFVHHYGSRSFAEARMDYAALLDAKQEIFRRKWNLSDDDQGRFQVDPRVLKALGFVPALHFEPLPGIPVINLWDWEKEHWIQLGEEFFQAGRLEEARRIFRKIHSLYPDSSRAANNLACTLWRLGDTEKGIPEAIQILQEVLATDPQNEDARWNLQEMLPGLVSS